ncbi:DNA helicase RuvA [Pseudomonas taeanensis MS-3]|uniref:DNA helicase RuvA n=1 Tax=Pseudomonas taeanensis MS-3 TaxID=1395571 RepID=A0A0A1YKL7_9PSED|nr:alpha/beta hydrolase [Pseudomonas taeanensis]KFX69646.1 DNA helicase RuvA [Pseudomonas taeanensis MS-3]
MSIWLDFLGAEIRYVDLPTYGRTRIAEAGHGKPEALILMHGIGGHLEAYAKNVVALGEHYHVIAFDYVGHGLSAKKLDIEYSISDYVEQLRELMDVMGIDKAHISGESLGGVVTGGFAVRYPQRVMRAVFNTTGGIPIVSPQGHQDLKNLAELSAKSSGKQPDFDSVMARMQWLLYEGNWNLLSDELVNSRLAIYSRPDFQASAARVYARLKKVNEGGTPDMIELEKVQCESLLLWTSHNPIHDVAAAEAALPRLAKGQLYVMKKLAGHWPQYESPEEFNQVVLNFLSSGRVA